MDWKIDFDLFDLSRTGCFIGSVYVGKYCIDIIQEEDYLILDYYLLGADDGYGYTLSGTPYTYKEGIQVSKPKKITETFLKNEIMKGFNELNLNLNDVFCELADWR